jgi:hypothetical protein
MAKQLGQMQSLHQLFLHLCSRGYRTLRPIFEIAIKKAHTKIPATTDFHDKKSFFNILPYHSQDLSSTAIQQIFRNMLTFNVTLKKDGHDTVTWVDATILNIVQAMHSRLLLCDDLALEWEYGLEK